MAIVRAIRIGSALGGNRIGVRGRKPAMPKFGGIKVGRVGTGRGRGSNMGTNSFGRGR